MSTTTAAAGVSQLGFCNAVFVFSSNLAGLHSRGGAADAAKWLGAAAGVASGLTGECYALPTKDRQLRSLPLEAITGHAQELLRVAAAQPKRRFQLTRVGCGLSGHKDEQIAPLFKGYTPNLLLPGAWNAYMSRPSIRVLLDVQPGASAKQILAAMAGIGERVGAPDLRRSILCSPTSEGVPLGTLTRAWRLLHLPDATARFPGMTADERRRIVHTTLIWYCSDLVSVSASPGWRSPLEREAREARLNVVIA